MYKTTRRLVCILCELNTWLSSVTNSSRCETDIKQLLHCT